VNQRTAKIEALKIVEGKCHEALHQGRCDPVSLAQQKVNRALWKLTRRIQTRINRLLKDERLPFIESQDG